MSLWDLLYQNQVTGLPLYNSQKGVLSDQDIRNYINYRRNLASQPLSEQDLNNTNNGNYYSDEFPRTQNGVNNYLMLQEYMQGDAYPRTQKGIDKLNKLNNYYNRW